MKKTLAGFAVAGAMVLTSAANAAVFDFIAMADNNADPNYFGESAHRPLDVTVGSINLKANGGTLADDDQYYAYLDAGSAGLGVCKVNTNNCGSDDNVTAGEVLTLLFDQVVDLSTVTFKNSGHGTSFFGVLDVWVDNVLVGDNVTLAASVDLNLTGTEFRFAYQNNQFYINTATAHGVPEPTVLGLLGLGFAGLGVMRRRRG